MCPAENKLWWRRCRADGADESTDSASKSSARRRGVHCISDMGCSVRSFEEGTLPERSELAVGSVSDFSGSFSPGFKKSSAVDVTVGVTLNCARDMVVDLSPLL